MGRYRLVLALTALLVLPVSQAAQIKTVFQVAGTAAGENVYEEMADGSFRSVSKLKIATTDISSELTGKFENGKLASYTLKQGEGEANFANGKFKAKIGEREIEVDVQPGPALFSNFHPQLASTIIEQLDQSTPGEQVVDTFILESGGTFKVRVSARPKRSIEHQGQRLSASVYLVRIGQTDIEYVLAPSGEVVGMGVSAQQFAATAEGYNGVFVDPTTRYPELSQPVHGTRVMNAVKIPMRDGIETVAEVILPEGDGPFPVVLSRTPYNRGPQAFMGDWYAKRGYVYVIQDVRGSGDSQGVWNPFMNERTDGYDTIDWISKQPWCNGNIGMIGGSYGGLVQWAAAVEQHPALKCIVPQVSPPDAFFNIPYDHGVPMLLGTLWWANIVKDAVADMSLAGQPLPHPEKLTVLPLTKVDDAVLGKNVPFFDAWWAKETPQQFKGFDFGSLISKVKIPALHISGWWDGDGIGTKLNYAAARSGGNKQQWLVYGPWTHAFNTTSRMGDVDYGPRSIMELDTLYLRWFDTWLKGKDVGLDSVPKVQVFVTGLNQWRYLPSWPDWQSKTKTLYFSRAGEHKGLLLPQPPRSQRPSTYTYDPKAEIVPEAVKGSLMGEGSTVVPAPEKETDMLVFRTPKLEKPLDITGPITINLHFSTSAKDTDFFAFLLDEDEKGIMRLICMPGKIRAKYLFGWNTPKLLTPGKEYKVTFDTWDVAHRFQPGHKMALGITSSFFPGYARNLGTGEPIATGTKMVVAKQTIFHDAARPSSVTFKERSWE